MEFFLFSSRRRHTILTCDWSSDVCSSDLEPADPNELRAEAAVLAQELEASDLDPQRRRWLAGQVGALQCVAELLAGEAVRSEERRVGKECRSRWSPEL